MFKELIQNKADTIAAFLRILSSSIGALIGSLSETHPIFWAVFGAFIGGLLGEIVSAKIPNQKIDRLEKKATKAETAANIFNYQHFRGL